MSADEYRDRCGKCTKSGDAMFARIFMKKINGKWLHLCTTCWDEQVELIF